MGIPRISALHERILAGSRYEVVEEPKAKMKKEAKLVWHVMEEEEEYDDMYEQNDGYTTITHEASANLTMPLLDYRKEWLAWALNQENSYVKGGILGKTIEAIALVLAKRERGCGSELSFPKIKSTFIVCSAVAVTRWVKENESCTIKGLAYTGDKRAKYSNKLSDFDFVVTSYTTVLTQCNNCNINFVYWSHSNNRLENNNQIASILQDTVDGSDGVVLDDYDNDDQESDEDDNDDENIPDSPPHPRYV